MSIRDNLRSSQAADFLGLSASTLAKKRVSGTGPRYGKLGRTVVYRRSDLEAWVQENLRQSTSEFDEFDE